MVSWRKGQQIRIEEWAGLGARAAAWLAWLLGTLNLAPVAGYGTTLEGAISLRIRDNNGTMIAEGSTQGGSNGVMGEFKVNLEFDRRLNRRLGVVEVFEESASGSSEDLHLDRVPIVFD